MLVKPGTYNIIRADGTEILVHAKPTLRAILAVTGVAELSHFVLSKRPPLRVYVDDNGSAIGKPANEKATALYWGTVKPKRIRQVVGPHSICGDVAIVNEADLI